MLHARRAAIARVLLVIVLVLVSVASLPWTPSARAAVITVPAGDAAGLIAAINTANTNAGADEIVLVAGATYTLTAVNNPGNGLPVAKSEITITGNGATITRDAAPPAFRILEVASGGSLTLNNLTISNGSASNGGGINSIGGTLRLTNSILTANDAGIGGSIDVNGGTLTLTNSTLNGNTAAIGGGISSSGGILTLTNSTLSGNTADIGGGINSNGSTLTLTNTIAAANTAPLSPDINGLVADTAGGHNLIGNGTGMSGLTHGVNGNQVGTTAASIDPLLGDLADNGGPTLTMALLPDSPAINAGNDAVAPDTDQRGFVRPQGSASDIGAVEFPITHAELCALTEQYVSRATVARSACTMLEVARRAGTSFMAEMALTNYRMQIQSAMSRRYVSTANGNELIALSYQLSNGT